MAPESATLEGATVMPRVSSSVMVKEAEPTGRTSPDSAAVSLRALQGYRLVLFVDAVIGRLEPQRGRAAGPARGNDYVEVLYFPERPLRVLHLESLDVGQAGGAGRAR